MNNICPLCSSNGNVFYDYKTRIYYQCNNCEGIFVDKELKPDFDSEKERYKNHINNVEDKNYQKFVSPITNAILSNFTKQNKGLDFGAGTGPVISKVLQDNNYQISQYDPFFHNYPNLLKQKYDYIACCEVIEHFYNPHKEFELLNNLLNKEGILYCMTDIYNKNINFHNWYYKNDPTHVFIYQANTLQFIKRYFNFSELHINERLIKLFK